MVGPCGLEPQTSTVSIENWLRRLQRADGRPLANSTKAKIRNLMSVLFNHAIRHEWLEQGRNPILACTPECQATTNTRVAGSGRTRRLRPRGYRLSLQ